MFCLRMKWVFNIPYIFSAENEETQYKFEPSCIQPDPTESLLEEMRSVSLIESNYPVNKGKKSKQEENCTI